MDWSLLAKYFANEANSSEAKEIEAWCNYSSQNKKIFLQVYSSWKLSYVDRINEKEAWRKVKKNLHQQKRKTIIALPLFYKIAASLLIIAALIYGLNKGTNISTPREEFIIVESSNKPIKIELTDGSIVHLNKNSIFKYPQYFKNKERKVFIDGEGFFEVAKKDNLPFIVSTSEFKIKVLGTSFNVDAFSSKPISNVSVKTGKVLVSTSKSVGKLINRVLLVKGEMASLNIQKDSLFKTSLSNDNYLAWKTGILKFDNTKLQEVKETLNRVYSANITFANSTLNSCFLTASFNNKTLEEVIDVLASTYKLKIKMTSKGIVLYGKGCS